MDKLHLLRTHSDHPDFRALVALLDQDLAIRDGDDHTFYAQFNKIDQIKHCIVALVDNQAVGCGAVRAYDDNRAEVKRMFVLPEFRGQGIAGKILFELEQWSAALGFERCILETGKKQPEAIQLYQKMGYQVIPNYGQYEGVENSVCMEKKLFYK